MRRYAIIQNGAAHQVWDADAPPELAPYVRVLDVTDNQIRVEQGFHFHEETQTFIPPPPLKPAPSPEPIRASRPLPNYLTKPDVANQRVVLPFRIEGVTCYGNVWVRRHILEVGGVVPTHKHNFHHLSLLIEGKVRVVVDGNETIYSGNAEIIMRKDTVHYIEALEPSIWLCVFAVRNDDGIVVEDYTGEQDPVYCTEGPIWTQSRQQGLTGLVPEGSKVRETNLYAP